MGTAASLPLTATHTNVGQRLAYTRSLPLGNKAAGKPPAAPRAQPPPVPRHAAGLTSSRRLSNHGKMLWGLHSMSDGASKGVRQFYSSQSKNHKLTPAHTGHKPSRSSRFGKREEVQRVPGFSSLQHLVDASRSCWWQTEGSHEARSRGERAGRRCQQHAASPHKPDIRRSRAPSAGRLPGLSPRKQEASNI